MKKNIKIVLLCITGIFLITIITAFSASGVFSKSQYLEPWKKSYSDKFDDLRIKFVSHGLLAASGHNMQPWKIKLGSYKNDFYLFADSDRLVKEVDPYARQTMITQGAFLEYVSVAGEKLGYGMEITLFPDGQYDEHYLADSMKIKPVAKIEITETVPQNSDLYEFMFLPDTNRAAYKKLDLTPDQIKPLLAINTDRDLTLNIFQDDANVEKLGNYALEGAKLESGIHRISEETAQIFRVNEYQKNKFRYGFSVEGQGTTGTKKHVLQGLLTLFPFLSNEKSSAEMFVKSTQSAIDHTPAYAMIITKGNSRTEQVKSGMLYSKLVLTAHSLGLVIQPLSQVLEEYSEMTDLYNKIHKDYAPNGGTIQMLFRIGQPTQAFPNSMRRDVLDLIVK